MKKFKFLAMMAVVLTIFCACQKDDLPNGEEEISNESIGAFAVDNEMLSFSSGAEVQEIIAAFLTDKNSKESSYFLEQLRKADFDVLFKDNGTLKSTEVDVYSIGGYDTLVPNQEFARLLNKKGEIMADDVVYKITPYGTYFFPKNKRDRFYTLYESSGDKNLDSTSTEEVPLGRLVAEKTYLIEEEIYRYDTFAENNLMIYPPIDDGEGGGGGSTGGGGTTYSEPNYDSFRTFNYGAQTWFGEIFEGIFGRNKGETVEFNSGSRRIKVNFYNYNYAGVYQECGVTSTLQKKNWIGWSNTRADELRVGWRNIKFLVKPPSEITGLYPPNPPKLQGNIRTDYVPGNDKLWNMVELWEWDVTDQANQATTAVLNLLKSLGTSINKPVDVVKNFKGGNIEYYFIHDEKRGYNVEQLNKVFTSSASVNIKFSPSNPPSSLIDWGESIAQAQLQGKKFSIDLAAGQVYGCALLGGEWQGIRVIKRD